MPSWVGLGGTHQSWAGATSWAAGTMWLLSGVRHMRALRLSHCLTCFTRLPCTCRWPPFCCGCFVLVWFVCCFCFPLVLQVQGIPISLFSRVLDDRQCFTARSARHKKKHSLSSQTCNLQRTPCVPLSLSASFGLRQPLFHTVGMTSTNGLTPRANLTDAQTISPEWQETT